MNLGKISSLVDGHSAVIAMKLLRLVAIEPEIMAWLQIVPMTLD